MAKTTYVVEVITVLENLVEVKYTHYNPQKPVVEWLELESADLQPYEKNATTIQVSKNDSGSVTSETENCSTAGAPSENGSLNPSARSRQSSPEGSGEI